MEATVADRLVLRALASAGDGITLPALHGAVALDPESGSLHTFAAEIGAALGRLLSSGEVVVARAAGELRYRLPPVRPVTSSPSNRSVTTAMSSTAASNAARLAVEGTR